MKSPLPALLFAILWLLAAAPFAPALGQEQHNSLAVDDKMIEEAGPYYFISYGDSSNAFAKAAPLAQAMGLSLSYDNESKTLTFSRNGVLARIKATSDVAEGLAKRTGVLDADGTDIASPMAIIVDGVSYVPIVPIAKSFGCDYAWHSQYRLITVNLPKPDSPKPAIADPAPADAQQSASTQPQGRIATILPPFRVGVHEEFTRVAVDLGSVTEYSVAVAGDTMVVTFGAGETQAKREEHSEGPLLSVFYARTGGRPALVVQTRHEMTAAGAGFRAGRTESNTLYIDFAPHLEGSAVTQLDSDWQPQPAGSSQPVLTQTGQITTEPLALAPAQPAQGRPTVVIDAGHGGRFAGARNGNWKEEEIVLRVSLATKALLEARGVNVILTRDGDEHLSTDYVGDLRARAAFATPERNLFVSIHANAVAHSSAHGIETFVFGEPLTPELIERAIVENGGGDRSLGLALTDESIRAASQISGQILRETQLNYSRRVAHLVQQNLVTATGARDRGVKQNALYVLRTARTPAILVELGFISNPEEGRKLVSDEYQAVLAKALAEGILEFLETGGSFATR